MSNEYDRSEEHIKELFSEAVCDMQPAPETLSHIRSKIHEDESGRNGGIIMFKRNYVKVAAVALVCIIMSGTAVYAGRGLTWYGSGSPGEYTSYLDLDKALEKAGLDVSLPEKLAGGFVFKEASIEDFGQMDDANQKVSQYKGINVSYEDERGQQLDVSIGPVVDDDSDEEPVAKKEIADGIIAAYDSHEMLMVPSRDEVSKEDQEREKKDQKFWISEGSEEPERTINNNVRFEIGDVSFDILGFDLDLTQDEMFDIAQEVADWNL